MINIKVLLDKLFVIPGIDLIAMLIVPVVFLLTMLYMESKYEDKE